MRRSTLVFLALLAGASPAQAASQWGAPTQVLGVPALANVSVVTLSSDGTVNAALIPFRPTSVVGVRRSPGGAWSPVEIPPGATGPSGAYRPAAVNRRGDLLTVARANGGPVAFVPAGGSPIVGGPAISVDNTSDVQPAVGDGGDGAIAWVTPAGALQIAVRPAATGIWSAVTTLSSTRPNGPVQIAVGAGGTVVIAWIEPGPGSNATLRAARLSAPAGSWEPAIAVRQAPNVDLGLIGRRVGVDDAGDAVVAWLETTGTSGTALRSAVLPAGTSSWSTDPVVATVPLSTSNSRADLSVSPDGHAVLAWAPPTIAGKAAVNAAQRTLGGGWGPPATLGSLASGATVRAGVADGGWSVVGWDRPAPSPLADTPQASVAAPGATWSAPVDLDAPTLSFRHLVAVAVNPGGGAIAIWVSTSAPGSDRYSIADFGPSSVPAVRAATRIVTVRATTRTGPRGTFGRITLDLSQPVEDLAATLQRHVGSRWVSAGSLRLNGQSIPVPVRLTVVGLARFRITFGDQGLTLTSRAVSIRVTRATRPTIMACADPITAQQRARVAWVLCRESDTSTLQRVDLRRRRRIGGPIDVGPGATSLAIDGGSVWVARSEAQLVPVRERTGRVDPPIQLGDPGTDSIPSIAATRTGLWALLEQTQTGLFIDRKETLLALDPVSRSVIRRTALPSPGGDSTDPIMAGSRGVWIPRRDAFGERAIRAVLRVDAAGRLVRLAGRGSLISAGPAGVWTLRGRVVRLDPPRGPSGPDLTRFKARDLAVGPDALWLLGRRGRDRDSIALARVSLQTGRITGPATIALTHTPGSVKIVPVAGGAWALVSDLGALVKVR